MATAAICRSMSTNQSKTFLLVDLTDVGYDPGTGIVASGAIQSDRLLVHIAMACITIWFGFGEYERFMTTPARHHLMLSPEGKMGFVVIECRILSQCPTVWIVAFTAFDF